MPEFWTRSSGKGDTYKTNEELPCASILKYTTPPPQQNLSAINEDDIIEVRVVIGEETDNKQGLSRRLGCTRQAWCGCICS